MFSTFDIIHNSSEKVYNRGAKLAAEQESIAFKSFTSGTQRCEVSGDVSSSSKLAEHFHAYIATDPEVQSILDFECSCPAARKSAGMCKHCVALAIAFKSDPESFNGFSSYDKPSTSYSLKSFISKVPKRSDLALDAGAAHLSLTLLHNFDEWSMRLEIEAHDARYVVADMTAFAYALLDQSFYSYGKRLGFVHSPSAFDDSSLNIASLVCEAVSRGASPKRELHLEEGDVVRLLEAVGQDSFFFEDATYGEERKQAKVVREDPEISLRILELEDGAYEIARDERIIVAYSPETSFAIIDGSAYRCSKGFSRCASFLKEVYCSERDESIILAAEDVAGFCVNVLPELESRISVSIPASLEELRPKDAHFRFYLDKTGRGKSERIECKLTVDYGQGEIVLLDAPEETYVQNSSLHQLRARGQKSDAAPIDADLQRSDDSGPYGYRDDALEDSACELALEYFDASMTIPLDDETATGELLYEGLPRFRQVATILSTPAFQRLIGDKKPNVQIGLSLDGDLIDMDIHSSDLSNAELADLLKAYRRHKKYARLNDGSIASLEKMDLAYLDRMASDLGIKPSELATGDIALPTYAAFILDREYSEAHRDASFQEYVDKFDNDSLFKEAAPSSLKADLREYQLEGMRWFGKLASIGFGGILADEMGLGKTLQAIAYILLSNKNSDATSLVVCPASLVYNWLEEAARFAPSLNCVAIDGPKSQRREKRMQKGVDLMICSYDAIRMDCDQFAEMEFKNIILDEAQFIKNHATKTTRAVKRLKGEHRFALTGTPIENRLSEIWSIFDFLMPGFLGTYAQFRTRFEIDILGGNEDVSAHFQALVSPFVLRRLKSDVLLDLPEKQESIVYVALEGEQRKLYDACEQNLRQEINRSRKLRKAALKGGVPAKEANASRVEILAELMRLRQIALAPSLAYSNYSGTSTKTDAIIELVGQAIRSGKKTLLFSQFTAYLDILKKRLDEEGVAYYEITGQTSKRARIDLVSDFNENDVPVFLISLKAGGTGLNLIGASVVIHSDPWWNAAAIEQATDRAHRIGQKEMVSVYKVIAKGTIEERIMRLQEKKSALADSVVIDNSLQALSSLTREELESLLFD